MWNRLATRLLLLLLGVVFLTGCFMGLADDSANLLSKAEERKIGKQVLQQVRHRFRFVDDPYVMLYLKEMGHELGTAMEAEEFEMEFHVVADSRINAFAVPGGHVFITSQTVLSAKDESELAGVVAHEMGHVEGRHIAYRAPKAARMNLAAMAAVLAGAFLGGGSEVGQAVTAFGLAGAQTKMLQYSRADEEDADRRALRALLASDYDGWGMVRFMDTIHRESPAPEGVPAYLFTHPLPENRANYLAASLPAPPERPPDPTSLGPLWRVQARVLVQDPREWGLAALQERVKRYPASPDAYLALGLLLRTQGRYEEALAAFGTAERLAPGDAEIRHEKAATELRRGNVKEGLAALEQIRSEGRATEPVLRDLGWAYLETEQGEKALAVYDDLAEKDPQWDKLAYYRGMALGKAGREGEGYEALGNYYRTVGRRDLAVRHYREALHRLPDEESRARVEKALEEMESERREKHP